MRTFMKRKALWLLLALAMLVQVPGPAGAVIYVQCPGEPDGYTSDAIPDKGDGMRQIRCKHLAAGDGYVKLPDGSDMYIFGYTDVTGIPANEVINLSRLKMEWPAPTMVYDEGDEVYLTLSNVGMVVRPDLFDAHSVHFHGFPQASSLMDGEPMASFGINMMSSLTYYYNISEPGTFMYHCHIEATEHMQMGMLGQLWIRPAQNRLPDGTVLGSWTHSNPDYNKVPNRDDPLVGDTYAYNDGDGSTRYDVEKGIMLAGFDPAFHDADEFIRPLPFADMEDKYNSINGRGYPENTYEGNILNQNGYESLKINALVKASPGDRVLLRVINLNITSIWSFSVMGLPMQVIAHDAELLRSPVTGENLYYQTNVITFGGGESSDVIVTIPADAAPGTRYVMYSTNLNLLSTPAGEMTGLLGEIVVQ